MVPLPFVLEKQSKAFQHYWDMFYPDIKDRSTLKVAHLQQLKIMCEMYVECDILQKKINKEGHTHITTTTQGTLEKIRPEVQLVARLRSEIKSYGKNLGFILIKDGRSNTRGRDKEEWE